MTARTRPQPIELPTVAPAVQRRGLFARAPIEPIKATAHNGATTIKLSGPISSDPREGVSAAQFIEAMPQSGDLVVRVFSPGGSVFDGLEIFNALARHPGHVRVEVGSLAASAASIVAMAADTLAIGYSAHIMVHCAWSFVAGPASDLRKEADILDSVDKALIRIYAERTGLSQTEIAAMLNAETWMLGADAVRLGFADEILGAADPVMQGSFNLSGVYKNVPSSLTTAAAPIRVNTIITSQADLEKRLREGLGLARGAARKIAAAGFPALASEDTTASELASRIAAATSEIRT